MKKIIVTKKFYVVLSILLLSLLIGYIIYMTNLIGRYNNVFEQNLIMKEEMYQIQESIDSLKQVVGKDCKWNPLVNAMIHVESRGDEKAIGTSGDYGVLQIRKIMVTECNNILKSKNINKRYKHSDAFDKDKSIEIFHIIAEKYVPDGDFEKMARIWNGGPTAHLPYINKNNVVIENKYYNITTEYWLKVKNALKNQENNL